VDDGQAQTDTDGVDNQMSTPSVKTGHKSTNTSVEKDASYGLASTAALPAAQNAGKKATKSATAADATSS